MSEVRAEQCAGALTCRRPAIWQLTIQAGRVYKHVPVYPIPGRERYCKHHAAAELARLEGEKSQEDRAHTYDVTSRRGDALAHLRHAIYDLEMVAHDMGQLAAGRGIWHRSGPPDPWFAGFVSQLCRDAGLGPENVERFRRLLAVLDEERETHIPPRLNT